MRFTLQSVLGFAALFVAASNNPVVLAAETIQLCDNIVDIACGSDDFKILCFAVQAANLADALSDGEWTVFTPTDAAFNELGEEFLSDLLANDEVLKDILLFHAVPDVVSSEDLECTALVEMANGQDSRTVCTGNGDIHQKGGSNARNDMPEIVATDIKTCQGYIHIVDEVMLPGRIGIDLPPKPACKSIVEIACSEDSFSTLCSAVTEAGLGPALSSNATTWTIFAPTNDAFTNLGEETLAAVFSNVYLLGSILLFHAISGRVLYEQDLRCSRRIEMSNGFDSRHVCLGDEIYQKGAGNPRDNMPKIVGTDIGACNGVIHVVDEVILPPM